MLQNEELKKRSFWYWKVWNSYFEFIRLLKETQKIFSILIVPLRYFDIHFNLWKIIFWFAWMKLALLEYVKIYDVSKYKMNYFERTLSHFEIIININWSRDYWNLQNRDLYLKVFNISILWNFLILYASRNYIDKIRVIVSIEIFESYSSDKNYYVSFKSIMVVIMRKFGTQTAVVLMALNKFQLINFLNYSSSEIDEI